MHLRMTCISTRSRDRSFSGRKCIYIRRMGPVIRFGLPLCLSIFWSSLSLSLVFHVCHISLFLFLGLYVYMLKTTRSFDYVVYASLQSRDYCFRKSNRSISRSCIPRDCRPPDCTIRAWTTSTDTGAKQFDGTPG